MEQGCQLSPFTIFTVEISERFCCSPARHSEIILVTLGLPTVPTLDHGICQWNRKMDDHTPAMWNLLEVSQCFTAVQMPSSLSAQQNQQHHAQNQLCPQAHLYSLYSISSIP